MGKVAKSVVLRSGDKVAARLNQLASSKAKHFTEIEDGEKKVKLINRQYIKKTKDSKWILRDESGYDYKVDIDNIEVDNCKIVISKAWTPRNIVIILDSIAIAIMINAIAIYQTYWTFTGELRAFAVELVLVLIATAIGVNAFIAQMFKIINNRLEKVADNVTRDMYAPIAEFMGE